MPTKVSATLLMSSPETPKSQILICPAELRRTFEGLTSARVVVSDPFRDYSAVCTRRRLTSVHNLVDLVEVSQARDDGEGNLAEDGLGDGSNLLVDVVEGAVKGGNVVEKGSARREGGGAMSRTKRTSCP